KKIKMDKKELEKFGFLLSAILFLLSHWFRHKDHLIASKWLLIVGLIVFFISIISPKAIILIQKPWMALANIIGETITKILLTVIYYIFFVPYALLLKIFGVKFFKTFHSKQDTYWIDKPPPKELDPKKKIKFYERQF
ncbi:MAG: hypothetical protein KKA19_04390, partial [Candidatus Margulisbacteria bacterium]|nr:hypothetical protein [Candidatus Margulisiibacteriota bacterium]